MMLIFLACLVALVDSHAYLISPEGIEWLLLLLVVYVVVDYDGLFEIE